MRIRKDALDKFLYLTKCTDIAEAKAYLEYWNVVSAAIHHYLIDHDMYQEIIDG